MILLFYCRNFAKVIGQKKPNPGPVSANRSQLPCSLIFYLKGV